MRPKRTRQQKESSDGAEITSHGLSGGHKNPRQISRQSVSAAGINPMLPDKFLPTVEQISDC
jgi:hypothetical protein